MAGATKERPVAFSRAQAIAMKVHTYQGIECKAHRGNFTRFTSNGTCVICAKFEDTGKRTGYIAKRADKLAYAHPVSPWPITAANMHLCPDLSPGRST